MNRLRALLIACVVVGAIGLRADAATVLPVEISVGDFPAMIALNPVTHIAYSADTGSDTVTAILGVTPIATIPVGDCPYGIEANPVTNKIYVANFCDSTLSIIDGLTQSLIKTVPVPAPGPFPSKPTGIAVHPLTNTVYVVAYGPAGVVVFDGATDLVTSYIPLRPGFFPIMAEVDPLRDRLYVSEFAGDMMHIIDTVTGVPISTLHVTPPPRLTGIAVDVLNNRIYLANEKAGAVYLVEYEADGITPFIAATATAPPSSLGTWGVEVNPLRGHVYAATWGEDMVHVFDSTTMAHVSSVSTTTDHAGPHFTALDPITGLLYVTQEVHGSVIVVADL